MAVTTQPIDKLLDALGYDGDRGSTTYKVICPSHDDVNPSLSIDVTDSGKVIMKCFGGCETADILDDLSLSFSDLEGQQDGVGVPNPSQFIEAVYDYQDEKGKVLYQTVRFYPKTFRQRQILPTGAVLWSIKGVRRVLYRLPDLLTVDPTEPVFITEGEKDADNLWDLGLAATTNVGGAGKGKWQQSYSAMLAGRHVVILPDNDKAGYEHAEIIADQLLPAAATVKVLGLPDLPPKGDVSDWLAAGNTVDDLLQIALDTPTRTTSQVLTSAPAVGPASAIQQTLVAMGHNFRYNLARERIEHADGRELHDGEVAVLLMALVDQGVTSKMLIDQVILAQAWSNSYDPLLEFFEHLEWDGQDHIGKLAKFFEDDQPPLIQADGSATTVIATWLRRWLVGAAGKALNNPVQNPMLVLVGGQNLGKSKFASWLGSPLPAYFIESAINPDSSDAQRWACGNFLWEVSELGATTRRADIEALKAFITRTEHTTRVPYAKHSTTKTARASFIGTVNDDNSGILNDATGTRRFLAVTLTAIDWKGYTSQVDATQVWAQAAAIYQADPDSWQLAPEEAIRRTEVNETMDMEDPVLDALQEFYDLIPGVPQYTPGADFVTTRSIVAVLETSIKAGTTRMLQIEVARAMKKLGVLKGYKAYNDRIRGYWGVSPKPAQEITFGKA